LFAFEVVVPRYRVVAIFVLGIFLGAVVVVAKSSMLLEVVLERVLVIVTVVVSKVGVVGVVGSVGG
jgi:hypothetical protein